MESIYKNSIFSRIKDFLLILYSISSSLSLAVINISLGLLFLITILDKIIHKNFKVKSFKKNKILIFLIIFLAGISLSLIDSVNLNNSFDYLKRFIYPIMAFLVIRLNEFSQKDIKKYSFLILISIFINLVYAYYQFYIGLSRVHGNLFVMEFAGLLSFLIIYIYAYIYNPKFNYKFKITLIFLLIFSVVGLILTGTRGVWLSVIVTMLIMTFLIKKEYLIYISIIFLIFISVSFIFLPDYYFNRLISILDFKNNLSNITRINLWRGAILIFKDNFINGVGLHNFTKVINFDQYYKSPMISTAHAHNIYFQVSAETGLLGITTLILLIYTVIKKLLYFINSSESNIYYFYSVFGIYITYLLQGMTEYNLVDRYTNIILWVFIAFSINLYEIEENEV